MKRANAPQLIFGSLICALTGHRFRISKKVTEHIKEYRCSCCRTEVTDTASGELVKLTPKYRETNLFLARFYEKRMRRVYSQAS